MPCSSFCPSFLSFNEPTTTQTYSILIHIHKSKTPSIYTTQHHHLQLIAVIPHPSIPLAHSTLTPTPQMAPSQLTNPEPTSAPSSRSPSPDSPSWVSQTLQGIENDGRVQPWKSIFADRVVNSGFDNGKDVITIKKTIQKPGSDWSVQGNSLAA